MSQVWVVRAGDDIEHQKFALDENCAVINFKAAGGSLEVHSTREEIRDAYRRGRADKTEEAISINAGQCYRFAKEIERGDYVVMPRKRENSRGNLVSSGHSAIGKVTGNYRYDESAREGCKHQLPVRWEDKNFPNSRLPWVPNNQLTVSRFRKNADSRVLESALQRA